MNRYSLAAALCFAAAFSLSSAEALASALKPKALVVMLDGTRGDVIENAFASNILRLAAGKWQAGYNGAWTMSAKTIDDAVASSAPNHASIALGVTAAKHGVTKDGKMFPLCDYAKWPSWLARIAEAKPDAKTLFMYTWKTDEKLCPTPKVEFVCGDRKADKRLTAVRGYPYARDLANTTELVRRLESDDAPDAIMLFMDEPDHGGHGHIDGSGTGFYPYSTGYLRAVRNCDRNIGKILEAIAKRPAFKDEDWLVIITADHGGYADTHGMKGGHATSIPLIVAGRNVKQGRIPGVPRNADVAATVLTHFGLDVSGMELDSAVVGMEAVTPARRSLSDALAVYMDFDLRNPVNTANTAVKGEVCGATASGAKNGFIGACLAVAADKDGRGGLKLSGTEKLSFENNGDFAMTMWVKMDSPQKGDPVIIANKNWKSRKNPGIALSAAKRTEAVETPGVVFNCASGNGGKAVDIGTYDVEYGKWTFYAATRASDGVTRLYQGASAGTLYCISDDTSGIPPATGLPFFIGQDGTGSYTLTFNGRVDDFAFWTRSLQHDEVRSIFEYGRRGLPIGDMLK